MKKEEIEKKLQDLVDKNYNEAYALYLLSNKNDEAFSYWWMKWESLYIRRHSQKTGNVSIDKIPCKYDWIKEKVFESLSDI